MDNQKSIVKSIKHIILEICKFLVVKGVYPFVYKKEARKPIEKGKIVFIENRGDTLPNSMTYIYSVLKDKKKYNMKVRFLKKSTLRYREQFFNTLSIIKDLGRAEYIFVCDALPEIGGFEKRPETKVVQLWHGCGAFKKFGFSTVDKVFGLDEKGQKKYPTYRNLDLVCVSSPEVVWAYEEAMRLENTGIVKPIGVSRTDVFFQDDYIGKAKERVYEKIPQARNKKIILYAPTFRGRILEAEGPDILDYKKMFEALSDEYIVLVKHHPFVKNVPEIENEYKNSFVYDVTEDLTIEDLICSSDICISDYSSLIFEYSLFNKPIILFAYDLEDYFDWRGFYYKYEEMAPGPIFRETDEVVDYIKHIDSRFDENKMAEFRKKFMESCDGHSTERILKEVGIKINEN